MRISSCIDSGLKWPLLPANRSILSSMAASPEKRRRVENDGGRQLALECRLQPVFEINCHPAKCTARSSTGWTASVAQLLLSSDNRSLDIWLPSR